uniref:HAT C-terminal dimerisation domain-containing protein n=1 Tax=Oryza brachyantha TaxID=4533 RepID=J3MSA7_ORYBR
MAIANKEKMVPIDWWCAYGGHAIDLQRFAKRIVNLCASSSGCESNWSTFEFIHTKKRNRLVHKRLNDVVFVAYNRKMKTRFQLRRENAGKSYDPLVIEEFDWDNEWADSLHEPIQGARGRDITWDDVDEAVGASHSLRGCNVPRRAHNRADPITFQRRSRNSAMVEEDEEAYVQSDQEEEEEDPHDDANVSDCDEAPGGTEDGEGSMDVTTNLNEFDDDF